MAKANFWNKKQLIFAIAILACAILLFTAGLFFLRHVESNATNYTPEQICRNIIGEVKYGSLVKVDDSQVPKHYDIPDGVISSCSVYISKSSESAEELCCFLLKDTSKYSTLQDAVSKHISMKAESFQNLSPGQYSLLKNYQITRSGRYVLVAVGDNAEAAKKIFLSMLS